MQNGTVTRVIKVTLSLPTQVMKGDKGNHHAAFQIEVQTEHPGNDTPGLHKSDLAEQTHVNLSLLCLATFLSKPCCTFPPLLVLSCLEHETENDKKRQENNKEKKSKGGRFR